ncbi:MAG: hypothetical protein ACOYKZ_08285 [Chlamydiia bacterium]
MASVTGMSVPSGVALAAYLRNRNDPSDEAAQVRRQLHEANRSDCPTRGLVDPRCAAAATRAFRDGNLQEVLEHIWAEQGDRRPWLRQHITGITLCELGIAEYKAKPSLAALDRSSAMLWWGFSLVAIDVRLLKESMGSPRIEPNDRLDGIMTRVDQVYCSALDAVVTKYPPADGGSVMSVRRVFDQWTERSPTLVAKSIRSMFEELFGATVSYRPLTPVWAHRLWWMAQDGDSVLTGKRSPSLVASGVQQIRLRILRDKSLPIAGVQVAEVLAELVEGKPDFYTSLRRLEGKQPEDLILRQGAMESALKGADMLTMLRLIWCEGDFAVRERTIESLLTRHLNGFLICESALVGLRATANPAVLRESIPSRLYLGTCGLMEVGLMAIRAEIETMKRIWRDQVIEESADLDEVLRGITHAYHERVLRSAEKYYKVPREVVKDIWHRWKIDFPVWPEMVTQLWKAYVRKAGLGDALHPEWIDLKGSKALTREELKAAQRDAFAAVERTVNGLARTREEMAAGALARFSYLLR